MKLSLALVTIVAVSSLAAAAHADSKDKAEALFKQGKKLMAEKRYADACDAFEKSYKLDAGIGTQLNIARCYEEWGKLGRAYLAYQAAEKQANDANDERAPKIHEFVVKLEPNVPHLTLKVPKDAPADLVVTLDGRPVDTLDAAMVVDPGPHTIEWSVTGSAKKRKIVPIDRGGDSEVSLDIPKPEGPSNADTIGTDAKPGAVAPTSTGRTQRMAGIALGGAGIIAIGVSSYMTLAARSDYNDALDMYCGGMKNSCDMTGLELTRDARSTANKATVVFLVGAALVGGGAALYFLAPDGSATVESQGRGVARSFYLTPAISPDGVGVVLGGQL